MCSYENLFCIREYVNRWKLWNLIIETFRIRNMKKCVVWIGHCRLRWCARRCLYLFLTHKFLIHQHFLYYFLHSVNSISIRNCTHLVLISSSLRKNECVRVMDIIWSITSSLSGAVTYTRRCTVSPKKLIRSKSTVIYTVRTNWSRVITRLKTSSRQASNEPTSF